MNQEPSGGDDGGIRPLWLVGGAAATLIIGACALISLLALGGVLWLTAQGGDNRSEPTQVSVVGDGVGGGVGGTVQATQALTRAAPTPLPAINASPNPTAILQTSVPVLAPDQAVRSYYQFVSQGRYDVTWQMLTDAFKQKFNCCAPNYNYSGYTDWWNSVNTVDFGQVRTVSQTGDRAVVYAELYYVMNSGDRSGMDSSPYIELVYDPISGSWRFDDKRATP